MRQATCDKVFISSLSLVTCHLSSVLSRIGKKPISIPDNVTVAIAGQFLTIKGPKGEISRDIHREIAVEMKDKEILITPRVESRRSPALWGLTRALVMNMVQGVVDGFEKKLEYEGVGFRVNLESSALLMRLGFSHPVRFDAPEGISFGVEKNTITVSGIKKELVGETAAQIRLLKPPEPYKGKGIRYQGEVIRRKAGKKAVGAA